MRGAPRVLKVGVRRTLGRRGYTAAQARYWQIRTRLLRYDFDFRPELEGAIGPGDTVVDVGANVGQYAALFSRLVGPTGRVIAFEPDPCTYRMLAKIAASNVEPHNLALADFDGTSPFVRELDADGIPNIGRAHLAATGEKRGDMCVRVARLDSIAATLTVRNCKLVKIDVEGAELSVLRGASAFVTQHRPLLLVDTCPAAADAELAGLGYMPWQQSEDGVKLFRPVTPPGKRRSS